MFQLALCTAQGDILEPVDGYASDNFEEVIEMLDSSWVKVGFNLWREDLPNNFYRYACVADKENTDAQA